MHHRLPSFGSAIATLVAALALLLSLPAKAGILFSDGDFGAQTLGSPVGDPWGPVGGGNTVEATAQSPFTNVYPDNGKGAHFPASAGNPYIVRSFPDQAIPVESTDPLYFNVDFRNHSADAGDYSIVITQNASGADRSVALYVTGSALYAESSGPNGVVRQAVLTLQPDIWYNLQLVLDMAAKTYSGSVRPHSGSAVILGSRPFVLADRPINCVYTDGGTSVIPGTAPDHDLDNWALSTTPVSAGPFVKSSAPQGNQVSANAPLVIELQDSGTQVAANTIQLSLNGQAITPVINKPAGADITTISYTPPAPFRPGAYDVRLIFADSGTPPVSSTNDYTFIVPGPQVTSRAPVGGGVRPDATIQIEITDMNTQVATNTIQLLLNGQAVTPVITKPAGATVTTVSFKPAGGFSSNSSNTVRLIFADTSQPPVTATNDFSFVILDSALAAVVVNIDINGVRNVPGPDVPGPTYEGQSPAGGGTVWNGILVDSRLEDGTDEDNLTVEASNLVNSLGDTTPVSFSVSPVGGDVGGAATTNPASAEALFSDYFFNNSAGNQAGESPFVIDGLGDAPMVDLYIYYRQGTVNIPGASTAPFTPVGIFSGANTLFYQKLPVTDGKITGTFGPGTTVINGLTIAKPLPQPFVVSVSPVGGGIQADATIRVELQDYVSKVLTSSVQLFLNDQAVTPVVAKAGAITTVTYDPPGNLPPESTNVVQVVFKDDSAAAVTQTNRFTFSVLSDIKAAKIINIDFNGYRNIPGPDDPGPTYSGQGAAGGGTVFNGIIAPSKLDDGTDDDNLTVGGSNLLDSLGGPTTVSISISPVGGDVGGTPTTDPKSTAALFSDYIFIGSAAQITGTADFTISGLGTNTTANLYFYRSLGNINIPGATPTAFADVGIFTSAGTVFFPNVPISSGTIQGTFEGMPGVYYGMSIDLNPAPAEAPKLVFSVTGNALMLTWTGTATLQSAPAVNGPWNDLTGATSPQTITMSEPARFYRLKR